MSAGGWSLEEQARRVAERIPPGSYVNLGIGMPTAVAGAIPDERGVTLYCENGIIGYGAKPAEVEGDPDIIDAGSRRVLLNGGASVVSHDLSFALARSGRLDVVVLGAYQVSKDGDLANWSVPDASVASVGGAMDLAVGARRVIVMMRHLSRDGGPKIVARCTYPVTARQCVTTVVTNMAVIDVMAGELVVSDIAEDITFERLQAMTDARLTWRGERAAVMVRE